jgi:hypothetical protein
VRALAELAAWPRLLPTDLPAGLQARLAVGLAFLHHRTAAWRRHLAAVAGGGLTLCLLPGAGELVPVLLAVAPAPGVGDSVWAEVAPDWSRRQVGARWLLSPSPTAVAAVAAELAAAPGPSCAPTLPPEPAPVVAAVDLRALRGWPQLQGLRVASLDGPGRFLVGPWLAAVEQGDWLVAGLRGEPRPTLTVVVDRGQTGLAAVVPGTPPGERAALPLAPAGLLALRLDRSWLALLREPERFLPADGVAAVRSFVSIADALDGASSSFVDDLVGGLCEPLELHVLPPDPPLDGPEATPLLQLPGFALVAPLRAAAAGDIAWRMAQAIALVTNAERVQRHERPFVVRVEPGAAGRALVAELPPWRGPGRPEFVQALSPTLRLEAGWLVLASTRGAAAAVLAARGQPRPLPAGDHLVVHGGAIAQWWRDHRAVVLLGRRLDTGASDAALAEWFDGVGAVAAALARVELAIESGPAATRLQLVVEGRR